ncbi:MAG: hypothetical protein DLM73_08200 [Chthoniobacterales bacterium]|nr:MAG: hypothetical protein DLM73_08200 [Chthoniobacterales bacterium]
MSGIGYVRIVKRSGKTRAALVGRKNARESNARALVDGRAAKNECDSLRWTAVVFQAGGIQLWVEQLRYSAGMICRINETGATIHRADQIIAG